MPAPSKPTGDRVAEATAWLADTPRAERGGHAVPELMKRFGLSAVEACAVIRANALRLARAN